MQFHFPGLLGVSSSRVVRPRLPVNPVVLAALALLSPLAVSPAAAWGGAGTAAMPGIAETPAARPAGLAGAYTALGAGPSAVGINPALVARDTVTSYEGSVRAGINRVGAVAWSFPATGGQWAVSATYVDYDAVVAIDENQAGQGIIRPFNLYPAVTYARAFGDRLHAGGTVKFARETLGEFEGSTAALGAGFDAGVRYQAARNLGLGLAVTNVGRRFSGYFDGDDSRGGLPAVVRAGAVYTPRGKRPLVLAADVDLPWHAAPRASLGAEYTVLPEWVLRAGTRWSTEDIRNLYGEIDPNAGVEERGGEAVKIAVGTTVKVGPVSVDYAAQWWNDLGLVHALTVAWSTGR